MWIFTKDGFFSAVQKPGQLESKITVRARCKKDIHRFVKAVGIPKKEIRFQAATDYEYRVEASKTDWIDYLSTAAENINYANFKHEVEVEDPERGKVYMDVWSAVLRLARQQIAHRLGYGAGIADRYAGGYFDDGGIWRPTEIQKKSLSVSEEKQKKFFLIFRK